MSLRQRWDGLAEVSAQLRRDHEAWRLFDELLVTALDGALALAEGEDVAVLVGEDLELDVARALDELFHVEVAVAEGAAASLEACWKRSGSSSAVRTMRMPRPPPPATALRMTG